MSVGAEIPPPDPALIRTGQIRAERARGIDLTAAPAPRDEAGWRGGERLQAGLSGMLTGFTGGLMAEAGKGVRLFGTRLDWLTGRERRLARRGSALRL